MTKVEGQHLPLAYVQACPHACFLCLDLLSVDSPIVPIHVASSCVDLSRISIPSCSPALYMVAFTFCFSYL